MRLGGMTLPGNGTPVSGSTIVTCPAMAEKSPLRNAGEGTDTKLRFPVR